jgi:dephospho-CoA kinase
MSGTGKSTALAELVRRGFEVVDTDDHVEEVEPLLRATCTHELDATQPIEDVVAQLVLIGSDPA